MACDITKFPVLGRYQWGQGRTVFVSLLECGEPNAPTNATSNAFPDTISNAFPDTISNAFPDASSNPDPNGLPNTASNAGADTVAYPSAHGNAHAVPNAFAYSLSHAIPNQKEEAEMQSPVCQYGQTLDQKVQEEKMWCVRRVRLALVR